MAWHYHSNGKQFGPVSATELRFHITSESIAPTDKVFGPGMTSWIPASEALPLLDASAASGSTETVAASPVPASSEGGTASFIGNTVIWLSLIGSAICVFAFGRIEIPDGPYSTQTQWSALLVSVYIAAGLNGMFFGYLLAKVGSVLQRLESSSAPV